MLSSLTCEILAAHAEYKSLQKVGQGSAVMYTTTFPCEKCAEAISEAGITEIIYYYDKSDSVKAKNIFKENRITYRYYIRTLNFKSLLSFLFAGNLLRRKNKLKLILSSSVIVYLDNL